VLYALDILVYLIYYLGYFFSALGPEREHLCLLICNGYFFGALGLGQLCI